MTEFKKVLGQEQYWGKHEVAKYYSTDDTNELLEAVGQPPIQPGELAIRYAVRVQAERDETAPSEPTAESQDAAQASE